MSRWIHWLVDWILNGSKAGYRMMSAIMAVAAVVTLAFYMFGPHRWVLLVSAPIYAVLGEHYRRRARM